MVGHERNLNSLFLEPRPAFAFSDFHCFLIARAENAIGNDNSPFADSDFLPRISVPNWISFLTLCPLLIAAHLAAQIDKAPRADWPRRFKARNYSNLPLWLAPTIGISLELNSIPLRSSSSDA